VADWQADVAALPPVAVAAAVAVPPGIGPPYAVPCLAPPGLPLPCLLIELSLCRPPAAAA